MKVQRNAQHKPSKILTTRNSYGGGFGIFVRRICCLDWFSMDIDEWECSSRVESGFCVVAVAVALWQPLWQLQCFRVFRFHFRFLLSHGFSQFFLALILTTKSSVSSYRRCLRRDQPDRTHHHAGSSLATRRGAYLRFRQLNPLGNNLISISAGSRT